MKPNFALSLSQDGIRLLHRAADEWQLVGEADFEGNDLGAQLEAMRQSARHLDETELRCKVVIPEEQIKYLSLPYDDTMDAPPDEQARNALNGATPYSVDQLAIDTHLVGQTLQVAAVALETLIEAEEFAAQNKFSPVSFVADPPEETFDCEPFFGGSTLAGYSSNTAVHIERDRWPVSRAQRVPHLESAAEDHVEEPTEVGFVSRRIVPTFRTDQQDDGLVPSRAEVQDFAEPATKYAHSAPQVSETSMKRQRRTKMDEATRMTVFGARDSDALADRRESLMRVAAVVAVVSLGIAGFASEVFGKGWSALFDRTAAAAPELRFAAPLQPDSPQFAQTLPATLPKKDQPARDSDLSDVDAAVLDALATPVSNLPTKEATATPAQPAPKPGLDDLQAYYAVYGIWPKAPEVPTPSALVDLTEMYTPGLDVNNPDFDAVALPTLASYSHDEALLAPANPAPAGTRFLLDEDGLVVPSAKGSLNADGVPVFAGQPPVRPPNTLVRIETPGDNLERRLRLSAFRPVARPDNLAPRENENSAVDAPRRAELADLRPRMRPESLQESALAAASLVTLDADGALIRDATDEDIVAPNARAVRTSLRPDARPSNFSAVVARAQRNNTPVAAPATARVAPRTVTPSIPSTASTAREATQRNAINLRKVNLIGVYGTPSSRRALIRLGNGRYLKVSVGDPIDGGRVSAIGDSELRYQKSGRAVVLKMPSS